MNLAGEIVRGFNGGPSLLVSCWRAEGTECSLCLSHLSWMVRYGDCPGPSLLADVLEAPGGMVIIQIRDKSETLTNWCAFAKSLLSKLRSGLPGLKRVSSLRLKVLQAF